MQWIEKGLNQKFAIGTAAGLLVSSLAFLMLFVSLYRSQLEQERSDAAAQVTRLLQTSLENAMLKRDLTGLQDIVNRLGREPGILDVAISNPRGEIHFASYPDDLGKKMPGDLGTLDRATTRLMVDAGGNPVLRSVNPVQLLVIESIRDLEQQVKFSHEQKLSELGRLAAGVAHEIHNPLAAVRMALHAADQANTAVQPDRNQVSDYLALVDQEVEKCSQVTERLLKLSVPPPEQQELVDADRVVDETLKLLRWEAETLSVSTRLCTEGAPLRILATDSDIRMVTLNLAQNACHAMPGGGSLTVRCERADGRIKIMFDDTGIGIDPRDRIRVFEPFFSRRADGVRGTGLGLSITKNIVENHQGTIAVEGEPGHGSRITVSFPDADFEI